MSSRFFVSLVAVFILFALPGCSGTEGHGNEHGGEHGERREHGHDRDGGEHGGEGEEDGTEYARNATYDNTRKGARLILQYEEASSSFVGSVENTTDKTLAQVRVEVHLSNGKELGPTLAADLAPGEKRTITLKTEHTDFERWNAHPEIGRGEHGHEGGEHGGEHGREGRGEHGGKKHR